MTTPISLTKGVPVKLQKTDGSAVSLKSVHVGAGWNIARGNKAAIDIDLVVLLLKSSKDKVIVTQSNGAHGVVYFGAKTSACNSVKLDKDNRTGAGDGYDENININLETIPADINCLPICINLYSGADNFGVVENAFIDVNISGIEPIRVDLTEDHATAKLVHVADVYRTDDGIWKVKKIDLGIATGFQGLMQEYGVPTTA